MASLEELLAEEGFKKDTAAGQAGPRPLPATKRAVSMPVRTNRPMFYSERRERMRTSTTFARPARRTTRSVDGSGAAAAALSAIEEYEDESYVEPPHGARESRGGSEEDWRGEGYKQKYSNELFEDSSGRKNLRAKSSFKDGRRGREDLDLDLGSSPGSEVALDRVAIKAAISILTGHLRRFFKDEAFRASTYGRCASCLGIDGESNKMTGVVASLKEAVRSVERAVVGRSSATEVKKASLELSVITGLSSVETKDGHTFGIPNSHLAACAHLYLALIFKFRKKDLASAKHVLHVFSSSPRQARTTLLPGLWERFFLPHLSDLKEWYDEESESVSGRRNGEKKMGLLEELYGKILDTGTYQLTVYYKDWLEGAEDPRLPSILVPNACFPEKTRGASSHSASSGGGSSPWSAASGSQATVSRKLYESLFEQKNQEADEIADQEEELDREEEELEAPDGGPDGEEELAAVVEHDRKDRTTCSSDADEDLYSNVLLADEWAAEGYYRSSKPKYAQQQEPRVVSNGNARHSRKVSDVPPAKGNMIALQKLAQDVFQLQPQKHVRHHGQQNGTSNANSESESKNFGVISADSDMNSSALDPSTEPPESFEEPDRGSFFSGIPKVFHCPLTGQPFSDPVTLETGRTYERAAIAGRLARGNPTCPATGRPLQTLALPDTNLVIKHAVDEWRSEHRRSLLLSRAARMVGSAAATGRGGDEREEEAALLVVEQLLTGFGAEIRTENARYIVSLGGGLQFLLRRLELGGPEEKPRVAALLLCCVEADGRCRSHLAANIGRSSVLELLHSKQAGARSAAVSLLVELICLKRRTSIASFLSRLKTEAILKTIHVLLVHMQSSPPEERGLVAVLLLHLDLMAEARRYSVYGEEAVDGIVVALDSCLSDEKAIPNTRRALLMLEGHFSSSGEAVAETWLLKQAGFYDVSATSSSINNHEEVISILEEEEGGEEEEQEAREREDWSRTVSLVLLASGKRSLLVTLSKCLASGNQELVRLCLTTVAWLSGALSPPALAEAQLSALSAFVPRLKGTLVNDPQIEHRVLASICLLNLSKISECRALLTKFNDEMGTPLESLMEVTWTAKHLYDVICEEPTDFVGDMRDDFSP